LALGGQLNIYAQCSTISGRVFTDYDFDGIFEAPQEGGVEGVVVNVFNNENTMITTTATASDGTYTLNTTGATDVLCTDGSSCYRVEFQLPNNYTVWSAEASMGGLIQRICDNDCVANLSAYCTDDYCQANPQMVTSCFIEGDNTGSGDVLVGFGYDSTPASSTITHEADASQIATTYGLAYQKRSQSLFASAFQKRFSGYGNGTTGSIYRITDLTNNTNEAALFVDLNALFGSDIAGADPHDFVTMSGSDVVDAASFDAVGKVSFGDMEITSDQSALWTVNLADKSLYKIPLGSDPANPVAPVTSAEVVVVPMNALPNMPANTSFGAMRPFALEIYKEDIYIGMVNDGSDGGDLVGFAYRYEEGTNTFTKVLEFPLTYSRGCAFGNTGSCFGAADWQDWTTTNTYPAVTITSTFEDGYPQPIFADMEIDPAGNLVVSLRDRFGDQGGKSATKPNPDGTLRDYDAFGDILYATGSPATGWNINIADFTDNTNSIATPNGAGVASPCPDGENFFGEDCYNAEGYIHEETNYSGIAVHTRLNQVASLVMDPLTDAYSSGIDWHDLETGDLDRAFQIITNSASFGKGNGLGDLELICEEAPLEVGNFVWYDADGDGLQDPCEAPLNDVTVNLLDNAGLVIGTTMTDANGRYYFGGESGVNMSGANELQPLTDYEIRIDFASAEAAAITQTLIPATDTLFATTANAASNGRDSDGVGDVTDTYSGNSFTTSDYGNNEHNYDFGFFSCPDVQPSITNQTCNLNSTIIDQTDDYFTVTIQLPSSTPSFIYEVVLNADADGTNGVVLATVAAGTNVTVGDGSDNTPTNDFIADGTSTYEITVRVQGQPTCFGIVTTTAQATCSPGCPIEICTPVTLMKN